MCTSEEEKERKKSRVTEKKVGGVGGEGQSGLGANRGREVEPFQSETVEGGEKEEELLEFEEVLLRKHRSARMDFERAGEREEAAHWRVEFDICPVKDQIRGERKRREGDGIWWEATNLELQPEYWERGDGA